MEEGEQSGERDGIVQVCSFFGTGEGVESGTVEEEAGIAGVVGTEAGKNQLRSQSVSLFTKWSFASSGC